MRIRSIALRLGLLVVVLTFLEIVARIAFAYLLPPQYTTVRGALAGENQFQPGYQKTTESAYLLYTPTPGLAIEGIIDHNSHGYRGKAVSMDRTPGIYRILCLGGSTTYGWGVTRAESAFPAQLEKLLNEDPPAGYSSVEVINAGAPFATSAEAFLYYHFKFHYYKSDLVILETGGNDAEGMLEPNYQPDYSNWRQAPAPIRPLAPFGRWLMHSRLIGLVVTPILYGQNPAKLTFIRDADIPPLSTWYPRSTDKRYYDKMPDIPVHENAFVHNTISLIRAVKQDGSRMLLFPFREGPRSRYSAAQEEAVEYNRKLLEKFAKEQSVAFAPFPQESVSRSNWVDSCHLNEAGCVEKARHLLPYVKSVIGQ